MTIHRLDNLHDPAPTPPSPLAIPSHPIPHSPQRCLAIITKPAACDASAPAGASATLHLWPAQWRRAELLLCRIVQAGAAVHRRSSGMG